MDESGLGVRSFSNLVDAFKLKIWQRFWDQQSLWASFMKSKYCKTEHPSMVQFRYPVSSVIDIFTPIFVLLSLICTG